MLRILQASPVPGYRLRLQFSDGVAGEVDLSDLAGHGVFAAWTEGGRFDEVRVTEHGDLAWGEALDLCADALYLRLTGKSADQLFPALGRAKAHA